MVRVVALLLVVLVAVALAQMVTPWLRLAIARTERARSTRTARPGGHDWDRRRDQLYRKVKRIGGPDEHRDQILAFLRELAKVRGLPVFDAARVGYPERMRRRRSGE